MWIRIIFVKFVLSLNLPPTWRQWWQQYSFYWEKTNTRPAWVCVCVLWPRWLIHGQREYVWLYCGRDGSYTARVSMCVCIVAEMDHTWSAWVCVCVLWPRWITHDLSEYVCLYCGSDGYAHLYCGRDGSCMVSVSMCVCTVAEMAHTRPAWACASVLWPRWIIHGQHEHACLYCGRDGSYTASVSMCVCTVAEMDHTWSAWVQVQVQVLYFSIYITITNMEGWVLKHCCCNPETRTSTHPTHIHTFTHTYTLCQLHWTRIVRICIKIYNKSVGQ